MAKRGSAAQTVSGRIASFTADLGKAIGSAANAAWNGGSNAVGPTVDRSMDVEACMEENVEQEVKKQQVRQEGEIRDGRSRAQRSVPQHEITINPSHRAAALKEARDALSVFACAANRTPALPALWHRELGLADAVAEEERFGSGRGVTREAAYDRGAAETVRPAAVGHVDLVVRIDDPAVRLA